jgi:RHS repeat-associated protein
VRRPALAVRDTEKLATVGVSTHEATGYGYNSNGDLTSASNGLSQITSYGLDGLKRIKSVTNAAAATANITYNALDSVVTASDFKGVTTTFARDALGNATASSTPDAGTSTGQFDSLGLPKQIVDALGQATNITRDLLGRPTVMSFADGQTTTLSYDLTGATYNESGFGSASKGSLSRIQDRSGVTTYKRDGLGRITLKSHTLTNGDILRLRYSYTAGGQLDTMSYSSGDALRYVYDATGRIERMDWNGDALVDGITWDAAGRPTAWNWAFADANAATNVPASRSYDTAGRVTSTELANYGYDAAGRITSVTQKLYGPSDSNPANSGITLSSVTWTVGYDTAGRITSFNAPGSTATFSYDTNGNRQGSVQSTANGTATNGVIRSYTVGSNSNRLLDYSQITVGPSGSVTTSASYSYNANGDLVNDGKRYNYNAEGRMTSLTTGPMASSKTTRYAYNALGQRVFKTEPLLNGGTTTELASPTFVAALQAFYAQQWSPGITAERAGWEYLYDEDGNLAAEYGTGGPDSAGSAKYMYLPTPNGPMPIVAFIDARRYAVHTDHLNTPRRLTLPSGAASWQWKYSAFGDEQPTLALNRFVNTSVNPNPGTTTTPAVTYNARYPGQYADKESGLNYNYFRTYNAETGRYTQADPIGLEGGWNRFGYVEGNALRETDTLGLQSTDKSSESKDSLCFDYDLFADDIRENRLDLTTTLITLGADIAVGTMPKTPSELRGLGVPKSQLNPYTSQLSRWSGRLGTRVLRQLGRSVTGVAVGSAATAGVIFEGFYDWTVIVRASWRATSTNNCTCKD